MQATADTIEGTNAVPVAASGGETVPLPVLTSAVQVKRLKREEALRHYPVRLSGVITCVQPEHNGFVLQDATRGVYVKYALKPEAGLPTAGERCELEGVTDAGFSPMVRPSQVTRRGPGSLPQPVLPSWRQLLDGSLDTQYVELQGIVTGFQDDGLSLLTHDGTIRVRLPGSNVDSFKQYENSVVCFRGCLIARHEDETVSLKFRVGEVDLCDVLATVLEPAPSDAFAAPARRVSDLFLYDPEAGPFQRVKVSGQILCERHGEYFLMEGTNGLRFRAKVEPALKAGDLVEVAGLLRLGGPSPVLREAVARKTGRRALPAPRRLVPGDLLVEENDATLVQVEGVVVSQGRTSSEEVIEAQADLIAFQARLARKHPPLPTVPVGSRVEFTGVLAGEGGTRVTGSHLTSADVLLNSPADLRILARPSWWNPQRLLLLAGSLTAVLLSAAGWIGVLHRQVERRTAQLRKEIKERERVERQSALEAERSRIARDLHDDLGSSMTEISMLAATGLDQMGAPDDPRRRFDRIRTRAQSTIARLDEIVWVVDPRKDNLKALIRYLAGYAEEYVASAGLVCRVNVPPSVPEVPLEAKLRYQLLLAVKEALNNAARHAHAHQVLFEVEFEGSEMTIRIKDDGRGFNSSDPVLGDGLRNLRARLDSVQGRCEVESTIGEGTTVLLEVTLPEAAIRL